eukprot:gene1197-2325_t
MFNIWQSVSRSIIWALASQQPGQIQDLLILWLTQLIINRHPQISSAGIELASYLKYTQLLFTPALRGTIESYSKVGTAELMDSSRHSVSSTSSAPSGASKAMQMLAKMQAIKTIHKQLEQAQVNATSCSVYARKLSELGVISLEDLADKSKKSSTILESLNLSPSDSFLINEAISAINKGEFKTESNTVTNQKKVTSSVSVSKSSDPDNPVATPPPTPPRQKGNTNRELNQSDRNDLPPPLPLASANKSSEPNSPAILITPRAAAGRPILSLDPISQDVQTPVVAKNSPAAALALAKAKAAAAKQSNMDSRSNPNIKRTTMATAPAIRVVNPTTKKETVSQTNNNNNTTTNNEDDEEESDISSSADEDESSSGSEEESDEEESEDDSEESEEEEVDQAAVTKNIVDNAKSSSSNNIINKAPSLSERIPSVIMSTKQQLISQQQQQSNVPQQQRSVSVSSIPNMSSVASELGPTRPTTTNVSSGGAAGSAAGTTTSSSNTLKKNAIVKNKLLTKDLSSGSESSDEDDIIIKKSNQKESNPLSPPSSSPQHAASTGMMTSVSKAVTSLKTQQKVTSSKNIRIGDKKASFTDDTMMLLEEDMDNSISSKRSSSTSTSKMTVLKKAINNPGATPSESLVMAAGTGSGTASPMLPSSPNRNVSQQQQQQQGASVPKAAVRASQEKPKPMPAVSFESTHDEDSDDESQTDEKSHYSTSSTIQNNIQSKNKKLPKSATKFREPITMSSRVKHNTLSSDDATRGVFEDFTDREENTNEKKKRIISTVFFNNHDLPTLHVHPTQPDIDHVNKKKLSFALKQLSSEEMADVDRSIQNLQRAIDSRDPVSARQASAKIADLCMNDSSKQTALGELGACAMITSLLWGWLKESAALEAALCAVASLCKDRDGKYNNNVKNIHSLRQAGALDMVVGTMQRNLSNANICEMGCLALTNLSYDEEERTALGTAGGCEVVVNVIAEHFHTLRVVERAAMALAALSKEKSNVLTLYRLDVCRTMVAILNIPNVRSINVSVAACNTLGNIGQHRECLEKLIESQGDLALVETLCNWSETQYVVEAASIALSRLGGIDTSNKALGKLGACEAIATSFRGLMPIETVAIAIAIAISELAYNSKSNCKKFNSAGICDVLVEALVLHDIPMVDETICWAIYRMAYNNPEIVAKFGSLGLCQQIAVVLERSAMGGNEVTVKAAIAVICVITMGNTGNQASFALTAVGRVLMTLFDDEWSASVKIHALWAINYLCRAGKAEDSINDVNVAHFMMANIHTELMSIFAFVIESNENKETVPIEFVEALCWATRNISMLYAHAFGRRGCQLVLEVLNIYNNDPRIVWPICSILRWLASCKEIVVTGDGTAICVAITQVMEDFSDYPAVCEAVCAAAVQLSIYDEIIEVFVSLNVCAHVVNIINSHINELGLCIAACATIHDIGISCSLAAQKIGLCGGCEAITNALRANVSSLELSDSVCCSIHVLGSNNSEHVQIFNEMNAAELIIDAMKIHNASRTLVIHACRAIWILASTTVEARHQLGNLQACHVIIESMRRYYDNLELGEHGCRAIYSLCKDVPENVERFGELDAYAVVMAVLQRAFSNQDVFLVGVTARAVMALSVGNAKNQDRFGGIGACELILGCMYSSWMRGVWNMEGLLLALAYLCRSDSSRSSTNVRNLNLLIAGGAVKIAVRELRKYTDNTGIARAGCIAIRNLAFDVATKSNLGAESACEAVVDVFNFHGQDVEVIEYAAGAIANLAGTLSNVTAFMDLGVYEAITDKLLSFVSNESVTIACCSAIVNLAAGNEENPNLKRQQQDQFGALEIHELLVVALDMHKSSIKLAVAACGAIMNLTEGNAESATVFGSAGACEAVSQSLSLHCVASDALAASACSAIWCLAVGNAKNKRRFSATEACEYVILALVTHIANPSSAEHACLAIRHLADGNTENSSKLGGAGACEAVIKVLSIHVGDTSVAEAASGAVVSLSTNNRENAKRLGGFGACDEVVRSIQKSITSRDETLASTSASAVSRLTASSPDNQQALGTSGACELMIELLQMWKKKPRVEAVVLGAIASLCRYGAERTTANALNISRMVKVGALEAIMKKLKDFQQDSEVCDAGCLALRNLAHEEEHQTRLGVIGACGLVLTILKKHMPLPDVTEKACGAISNLALISNNAKSLADNDVFALLGQAFFMHLGILDTAIAICGAVVNLTANGNRESAPIMESSGIFKSIVKALNVHIESPYMGMAVCLAIANLIHICQGQSRDEFISLGACEAIVAVFQHNSDNPRVVMNACRAAYHLAFENNGAKDRFGRLGACEMITRGLLAHYENEEICDNACLAIRNMSANHLENKSRFGGVGGCRAVIKALITHPANLSVSEAACLAVRNLSGGHADNVMKFGDSDAVKVLRGVLQNHVSSETVVEQACASLANIVANNEPLKAQLHTHNAAEPIVLALQVHHSNSKILAHVCLLIANMAGDNLPNATQLMERGACETLVVVLRKNYLSGVLSENACSAITNMCFNEDSIARLSAAGVCDAIGASFLHHIGTNPGVNEAGADAIAALAQGDNSIIFGNLGVCKGLCDVLFGFSHEISVAVSCCNALTKLSSQDINVEFLRQTDIAEALSTIIKNHMYSDTALIAACNAIYNITKTDVVHQANFGDTGLPQLLMEIFSTYSNNPEVLSSASDVISNLAENPKTRSSLDKSYVLAGCNAIGKVADDNTSNKITFSKENVASLINSILQNFPGDHDVLTTVFYAIWKLIEDCEANLTALTTYRVATVVVENTKSFMTATLCRVAFGAIAHLSVNPANSSEMRSLGVCDVIATAFAQYVDVGGLAMTASEAIAKLSQIEQNNAILLQEKDVCKTLTLAFQKHLSDGYVVKKVAWAISNIIEADSVIANQFSAQEISSLLSVAFINHSNDVDVLTELCDAVASLSRLISGVYKKSVNFECQVLVNILNGNLKNRKLVRNACQAIANLAESDPELSELLGSAGACDSVLGVLKTHDEDPQILNVVSNAISKLAGNSLRNAAILGDIGGPQKITEVLRKMALVESVIPSLCEAIRSMCIDNVTNKSSFGDEGACELLLDVLKSQKAIDLCVIAICGALYILGEDHDNRNALVQLGASDLTLPIIEYHSSRGLVMASLFLFLSILVTPGSQECIDLGKDAATCNTVISAFRNHCQNPCLVADACRVIHCLSFGQEDTARLMGSAGLCELLGNAIRDFTEIPDTIEQICYAVGSIQCAQNIIKLKNQGVVGILVKILKNYIPNPKVAKAACFAIRYISGDEVTNQSFSEYLACEVVLTALSTHTDDNPDVTIEACWALRQLCFNQTSSVNLVHAFKNKGCSIILRALRRHASDVNMAVATLWMIRILATEVDGRSELGELGGCETIIQCLQSHSKSSVVVTQCFWVINNMSNLENEKNLAKFTNCDGCSIIAAALKTNIATVDAAEQGMIIIRLLCEYDAKNSSIFVKSYVCETVIEGLVGHMQSAPVSEHALAAMRIILKENGTLPKFVQLGAVRSVVQAGKNHPNVLEVCEQVCQVMSVFIAQDRTMAYKYGDVEACELLCDVMRLHNRIQTLMTHACTAVSYLCLDCMPNSVTFGTSRILESIISGFQRYLNSPLACKAASDAIHGLCCGNEQNASKLGQLGVCDLVVTTLQKYRTQNEIVESALCSIWRLAEGNGENRGRLGAANACEEVLYALKDYIQLADTASAACAALWHLADGHAQNRHRFEALNASNEVQKVLKIHLEREDVTKNACGALWSMVVNASNEEGTSMDGCRAVVNALILHLESPGLAEVGCIAMANMSSNLASVGTLGVVGACDIVVKTMVAHIRDVVVVEAVCGAICTLSLNSDNKNRLHVAGANKVVLNALQVHVDKVATAAALLKVIARMAEDSSPNAAKFLNLGVCDLFTLCLKLHPDSQQLSAMICECIVMLATSAPECLQSFGESGLCEAVVNILTVHVSLDARDVCEHACKAACQMAYHLDNLQKLMDAGALLAIVKLVQSLPDVPNIVVSCAALTKFMTSEDISQRVDHQNRLAEAGMCEGLVQTLGVQLSKTNVLKIVCQALYSLGIDNDVNKKIIFDAGISAGLTAGLESHGCNDITLSASASSLIHLVCISEEQQSPFGDCGACEAIAAAFQFAVESRDEYATEKIAQGIISLIKGHPVNQTRMSQTAISRSVAAMLHGWVKNVSAEEVTLWVIAYLCRSGKGSNTTCMDNITALRVAGIYDGVMGSMRRHVTNQRLCQAGCFVIRNLACEMDQILRLQGAGACEAAASALISHSNNSLVVEAAAGAIANLAVMEESVTRFFRMDVCQALARAMAANYGSQEVVTNIFAAMQNLSLTSTEVKDAFATIDVIPNMLHIGVANYENLGVMVMLCGAIDSLASNHDANKAELGRKGACEIVVQALIKFAGHETLVAQACGAIKSLTENNRENSLRVGEAGGCECIVCALEMHVQNEMISIRACQAIRHMATGSEKNMKKLCAANAPDIVIRALKGHEGSVVIAEAASWALRTIATSSENQSELGEKSACEAVMSALKTHLANASATEQNLAAVVNLTIDKSSGHNIQVFYHVGICDVVTEILRRFLKIPEVCIQACWVTENVAQGDIQYAKSFGEAGVCETIVAILRRHLSLSDVAERSCLAIAQLATDESNITLLGSAGACEAVSAALQTANQQQSVRVACAACRAICKLSENSSANQDAFGMAGACRFLSATIAGWVSDFDLLEHVLFALALLCRHGKGAETVNEFNCAVFSEQRVDECIVKILQKSVTSARIAEGVSVAIRSLAYDKETRGRFGELGICSLLPIMLLQYGERNERVAESAAAAIATLAVIPENKMMLSESGACEAVLTVLMAVLDKNESQSGAQTAERCCWALQNLSLDNKLYSEKLGRDGVCEALVLTLKLYIEHDSSAILSACGAIWNISNGSPENKVKFSQCGLAPVLVKALQLFDAENSHTVAIAGAIRSVTSHKETPESFVSSGASEALVKALRKHIKNASVVEQIGGAIANIVAADDRSKEQLEIAGVCETIVGCMRRHSDNVVISAISCRIVGNLSKSVETAARLGTIGACESVTNALRRFGSEVAACQQACYAIRNLAQESENKSMLGLCGACELLTATLRRFNDSRLVSEQICGAITNLCTDHSENNTKLNLSGASELVSVSLKTHMDVSPVVEQACRAVSILAINVNRRYNLGVLGVCEGIIGALEIHLYDAKVLVSVINSLSGVSSGTVECQHTFGVNNACELLTKALGIHKLRPDVTEQICYAIYALSENNVANMKRFGEVSVCDGVVSALYDHQDIGWVCAAACRAIHALSLDDTNLWSICSLRASERVCLILRAHMNDISVVVSACSSITALTRNETQQTTLRNNSACSLVVDAINLHANDLSALRTMLETISALSKDTTNASVIGKSNLCAMLTTLLEQHKGSAELVSYLTFTMYRLLNSSHNCMHFGTGSTYSSLIENMQRHGTDVTVALNACLVMQKLALSPEQKLLAGSAGGCEGLVNALLSHVMNTELVKGVCKALVSVCEHCESNVERAGSAGVCDLLMSLVQRHIDHPPVVAAVFETIKALSSSTLNKEKFGGLFGGLSGCAIITKALSKHSDEVEVVQYACEAIVSMCKDNTENASNYGINDAHTIVLQSLQKHMNNEYTTGAAAAALWSLAFGNAGNNARIAEAGAIAVLVEAIRRHGTASLVCGGACGALGVILEGNNVYLGTLKAVDARRAVVAVLGVHFEDAFASQNCLHLLRVMYERGQEENIMPCEGECPVIVKCLSSHMNNMIVAEEACSVIAALGANAESPSSKLFGSAGASSVVCAALERAITNKNISLAYAACSATLGLCRGNSNNQEELGVAGACRQSVILLSVWQDVPTLEKLEDIAMGTIVFLCRHDKDKGSTSMANIDRFRAVGACEAVSLVLEKRMERPFLVELCCRAIANLANDSACCSRLVSGGACELVTRALRIHQESYGVAEYACAAIANLSTTETSKNVLALAGACEAVVGVLFRRCDLLSMATQTCIAIQNMSSNDVENKSRLGGAGACKAVTMVLQAHHDDALATQASLGAMVNIVNNHPVNADRLISAGACETIVKTAEKFYQNEGICKAIFAIIRILSVSAERRRILRDVGACEVGAQSLRHYASNENIAGNGCASLAALVEDDIENMGMLGRLGICQIAVEVLISHASNPKVTENACNLILALASKNSDNRAKLIAAGAPDAIIKVLDKNIESRMVAIQSCHVVKFLASDMLTRAKLSVAGACPKVVEMLRRHVTDATVAGLACGAVHGLAEGSVENRQVLADAGVCELIATVLQSHCDDCDASREACLSVVALTDGNSSNLAKLSTRNVCLALSSVLQRHRSNAELTEAASRALKNLASLPESRTFLGRNGVCQPLADALLLHINNPSVVKAIAWGLFALATDEKLNSETLGSVGACEGIVQAIKSHMDDVPVVEAGISTMWTLAANIQTNKNKLGASGACEVVVNVLAKYSHSRDISKPALVAMRNLASNNSENKAALGSAGACAVVVRSLSSQSNDTIHVEQACGVMANLANNNTVNANLLSQAGAAEVLADVLKSFVGHTAIMKQSCLVVCHMASANIPQLKFRELGICDSVVKVLSAHVNSNIVNAAACAAVRSMSFDNDSKVLLGESGVCAAVCKALSVGLEVQDTVVVEEAVHTITVLTRGCASHQDIFGNSGVCEMLIRILRNGYSYEVNEKVIWSIAYLCRHDTHVKSTSIKNVMKFTEAGIGQMIIPLLQTNINSEEFVLAGCITIRNLCSLECNVLQIGQLQGCEVIVGIVKRYHQFDNICEAVCGAIANLAKGDCRIMFFRAGVCQLLVQLLVRYSDKPTVMEQICGCISNLATDCQENKQVFGDCEACEAVVRVLRKHQTVPAVSLRACMTIRNLASNHATNKTRLGAAGACETVVNTLKMYSTNPAIVEVCDSAIRALATGNVENSNRIVAAGGVHVAEGARAAAPGGIVWKAAMNHTEGGITNKNAKYSIMSRWTMIDTSLAMPIFLWAHVFKRAAMF